MDEDKGKGVRMIDVSLYESESIRLAAYDFDQDPAVEAPFTEDLEYARMLREQPFRPLAALEIKKIYEDLYKQMDEKRDLFVFAVRLRSDDRLIGATFLRYLSWSNGVARLDWQIGAADSKGLYDAELLRLMMTYVFEELNLYRVKTRVPDYDEERARMCLAAGLKPEVHRRQVLYHAGRYWDETLYAMLLDEWQALYRKGV